MSENDPLNRPTSVDVGLSEAGISASTNSRLIAAKDRLLGNAIDWLNLPIEERTSIRRIKIESRKELMAASLKKAINSIEEGPAEVAPLIENLINYSKNGSIDSKHREEILSGQRLSAEVIRHDIYQSHKRIENKLNVFVHALSHLENRRDSREDEERTSEELSDEFIDRFDRYAEDATTAELQERWGRILAGELLNPGSISKKAMRIVDEIDKESVDIFVKFSSYRLDEFIPQAVHHPTLYILNRLLDAGLIVNVTPHNMQLREHNLEEITQLNAHNPVAVAFLGKEIICFNDRDSYAQLRHGLRSAGPSDNIYIENGRICIRGWSLTSAGKSLAGLSQVNTQKNLKKVLDLLHGLYVYGNENARPCRGLKYKLGKLDDRYGIKMLD